MCVSHPPAPPVARCQVPPVPGNREPTGAWANDSVAGRRVINEIRVVQDVEKPLPESQNPASPRRPRWVSLCNEDEICCSAILNINFLGSDRIGIRVVL